MAIYYDLLQSLKGQHLSSVFSSDGTLISVFAASHCGMQGERLLYPLINIFSLTPVQSTMLCFFDEGEFTGRKEMVLNCLVEMAVESGVSLLCMLISTLRSVAKISVTHTCVLTCIGLIKQQQQI